MLKNITKYFLPIAIIVFVAIVTIATKGLTQLKINTHYTAYFSADNPNIVESQYFQQQYGASDKLIIALQDDASNILSTERIIEYNQLQNALEDLDYVVEVTPFYNKFVFDAFLTTEEALEDIMSEYPTQESRLSLVHEKLVSKHLLSKSNRLGLINISFNIPVDNPQVMVSLSKTLDTQITTIVKEWKNPPKIYYSGTIGLNKTYLDVVRHDIKVFIPGTLIVFCLGIFCLFRQFSITLLLMAASFSAVYIALGMLGLFAFELTAINIFTPVIIITLSLATNIHLVISYLRQRSLNLSATEAIKLSIESNKKPYCLSLLTTAFGFLLLATSPSPPIKAVGYSIAIAMIVNMLIGLYLLPKLLVKIKLSSKVIHSPKAIFTPWFGDKLSTLLTAVLQSHAKRIVIAVSTSILVALVGLFNLQINDDVYQYFPEDHNFNQGISLIEKEFNGVSQQFYELSVARDTIFTQSYIDLIDDFSLWANNQHEIAEVITPLLNISQQKKSLESIEAQVRTRVFSSLTDQWVKQDLSASKFILLLKKQDADSLIRTNNKVQQWFALHSPKGIQLKGGSWPDLTFAYLGKQNASSMLYSLVIALVLISLLIGVMEKSLRIAFLGLLCNLFPVLVVYGIWSLIGGYISLGVALVMGMVMGIIVDDTLHLILKRHQNNNVFTLLSNVAPAITITSILIMLGLTIGLTSNFTPIKELSLLTIFCIFVAMVADLLLLPLLLERIKNNDRKKQLPVL